MKTYARFIFLLAAFTAVSLPAADLNVFAAASLSDALQEIARKYEATSGDKPHFNLAASSVLARQIKEGAPADIFISADEAKMEDLAAAGLIVPESRHSLLSNTLVIIVPADSKITLTGPSGLANPAVARLALAEPETVPAGIYAKAYLQRIKLWEQIAPKVIPTENVRACLAVVESANVDAGIVYKTDALTSKKVHVVFEVPAAVAPRIIYPFARLKASKQAEAATRFAAYLASSDAKAVFEKYGFTVLPLMPPEAWQIIWFTLGVAALSTLLNLPPAVGLGWLLARREWRGKSLVETLVALPLVIPPVATGLLLLKLFGRRGPLGDWLAAHPGWEIVFTWRGVVIATAVMSFPLLARAARVAFEGVNPRFEQVARTLGAGPVRVFVSLTLPLAARGLVAGLVLAFARALGEFGATVMVAGYIPGQTATLSLSIYHLVQLNRDGEALRLLGVSVAIAFAAVWFGEWFLRRRHA